MPTVQINGREVTIERVKGRKVFAAMAIIRRVSRDVPRVVDEWNEFQRDYAATNVVELDRVQARMRYGPMPVYGPDGELVHKKDPETGKPTDELEMVPSRVDNLSEADWEKAGNKLRIHESPSREQAIAAMLPAVMDVAEQEVAQLLALFVMSNQEVNDAARAGNLWDDGDAKGKLAQAADDLLDNAYLQELIELAVVCGEVIDGQVRDKLDQLGDRAGKALRVFGLGPKPEAPTPTTDGEPPTTQPDTPTTSPPPPASDSDASAGDPAMSSSSPGPSSAPSLPASTTKTT